MKNDGYQTYQDPVLLYTTILKMFKGCISVCDPFCGSGTTGKACSEIGLNYTGIDLLPEVVS